MQDIAKWIAIVTVIAALGCSSNSSRETPRTYRIGGTVAGLAGTGLVLQNPGAGDLAVAAGETSFQFTTAAATGQSYAVSVKTQPSNPVQVCTVASGTGTVADADVSVAVTCETQSFTISGTVSGLTAPGLVLHNSARAENLTVASGAASYAFHLPVASGSAYVVSVGQQPGGLVCTVANASGTVGVGAVTNADVTCAPTYSIGGTVSGLSNTKAVKLQNNGGDDLTVSTDGPFAFPARLGTGAAYQVSVLNQPAGQTCTVAAGAGVVAAADVTSVGVSCVDVVVQRWTAPDTWGGLWAPSATMVQHAYFDGSGIIEDPLAASGISWTLANGAEPPKSEFRGFPAGSRWGAGPFTGQRYQATGDSALDAVTGDMIVCAMLKPDYDPTTDATFGLGHEKPIIARGVTDDLSAVVGGGWALTQTRDGFAFHYTYLALSDNRTVSTSASVPTFFANGSVGTDGAPDTVAFRQNSGPLNSSYVVFCGGRAGNDIYAAVNGVALDYSQSALHYGNDTARVASVVGPPYTSLDKGVHHLSIGGYDTNDPRKVFGGRVYETAIWKEAGTPQSIQAKLAEIQGLNLAGARYFRNREGPFFGADAVPGTSAAGYHTAWVNGPRIDASRGFLFGLQAWNRVSGYAVINTASQPLFIFTPGEDFSVKPILGVVRPSPETEPPGDTAGWTATGGATVGTTGDVAPPGDSEQPSVRLVTLPVGGQLAAPLREFDSPGPIHGQIWLRAAGGTAGTLRIATTAGPGSFDFDLGRLPADTWTRVWLYRAPGGAGNELRTTGSPTTLVLQPHPSNAGPISFHAWGLALTQIGTAIPSGPTDPVSGGVELGAADLGAEMYDWSAAKAATNTGVPTNPIDALQLPPVAASAGMSGFCLSFDAAMPAGLAWTAPFTRPRTGLAWVDGPAAPTRSVMVYLGGATVTPQAAGQICFSAPGVGSPLCAPMPASFAAGSKHTITACMSAAGRMRIVADGDATPLVAAETGIPAPDLSGGTLLVGGASVLNTTAGDPWHGYISKAVVCRDTGDLASCQ